MSILLTTEAGYPYHRGGSSTWCDALMRGLPDVDFRLLAVSIHPYLTPEYAIPPNVSELVTVPLWGTRDPAEYGTHGSFRDYVQRRRALDEEELAERFVPQYAALLSEIVHPVRAPRALGLVLLRLHLQLQYADPWGTLTHPAVWDVFDRTVREGWRDAFPDDPPPSPREVRDAWQLLARLLLPLAAPVPRVDVAHSSAAGVCGLPCVMAKLRWGTPYLLTEHGVYLRDQYLDLERTAHTLFARWMRARVMSTVADVNYAFADQVSPVCRHSTRWERWRHVDEARIHVIYSGVDTDTFSPEARPPNGRPTVVSVAQFCPLGGQLELIEAAAIVRPQVPDVVFRLYGAPADDVYLRRCEARVRDLALGDTVVFAGCLEAPWAALRGADVAAFASVSEAFPLAVVGAMATACAVVATDVAGVPEAGGDAGLVVRPDDRDALANAIAALLRSPHRRRQLGRRARERVRRSFTQARFAEAYRQSYERLVATAAQPLALQDVAMA